MPPPHTTRILCFGDSLTSGFCHYGLDSHPYSIPLETRLFKDLPDMPTELWTSGVPGDKVCTEGWRRRLVSELQKADFDWVIMLGGTNDLGWATDAEEVFEALEEFWEMSINSGCQVLALTVPECAANNARLNESRETLNRMILDHKAKNFHSFDLNKHIPYHSLTDDERDDLWDDGLHLSPPGYDWMGGHIADAVIPLLKQDHQVAQAKSRLRQAAKPTKDDSEFDEEGGNAKDISQGYIVVRKKDLD